MPVNYIVKFHVARFVTEKGKTLDKRITQGRSEFQHYGEAVMFCDGLRRIYTDANDDIVTSDVLAQVRHSRGTVLVPVHDLKHLAGAMHEAAEEFLGIS